MERRKFIRGAAIGGGAALAMGSSLTANAQAAATQWRLQTSYTRSAGDAFKLYDAFGARVARISNDRFKLQVLQQNEAVPDADLLSAVSKGTVEAALTVAGDHASLDKAFAFVSGVPFGLNARLQYAWYRFGGGKEVLQELFAKHKLVHFVGGSTGAQMAGFFKAEVKSLADLKGLKIHASGMGSEVLAQLGAAPQQLALADVAGALKKGTIGAAQLQMPLLDEKLGVQKEAKFYYTLGFGNYDSENGFFINSDKWAQLSEASKETFFAASTYLNEQHLAYYDAHNTDALARITKDGAQLRVMPKDVLAKAYDAAFDLYETEARRNPLFKKIYMQWSKFREDTYRWNSFNEFPIDQYVVARLGKRRSK